MKHPLLVHLRFGHQGGGDYCTACRPGQLVEDLNEPLGLLLLLLLRHALHGVRQLRFYPPGHRVDSVFNATVFLGIGVRVAGVGRLAAGASGCRTTQKTPGGQQPRRIAVACVLDKTPDWKTNGTIWTFFGGHFTRCKLSDNSGLHFSEWRTQVFFHSDNSYHFPCRGQK